MSFFGTGAGLNPASTSASSPFSFNLAPVSSTGAGAGLNFGSPVVGTGLNFGTASTTSGLGIGTSATPLGLNFGTPAATSSGLNFGTPAATSSGLNFGTPAATSSGLNFGASAPKQAFSFGTLSGTPATSAPGPGLFGSSTPGNAVLFGTPSTAATTLPPVTSSVLASALLSTTVQPTTTGSTLGGFSFAPPAASTSGTAPILGGGLFGTGSLAPTATSATSAVSSAAPLTTTGFSLTGNTGTSSGTSSGTVATTIPVVTNSSVAPAVVPVAAPTLSVRSLEDRVNKWLEEMRDQEAQLLRQAAHVNAWDQLLQSGHEQVQQLRETLDQVKCDQTQLESQLDFIKGQQTELEQLLEPLESAAAAVTPSQQHQGDQQRENMYLLAQNLYTQLRQMTEDLSRVIEHVNSANGSANASAACDPVSAVTRILSAHMDSLRWVDQNSSLISDRLNELSRSADLKLK